MIYAEDLAALILALLADPPRSGTILEPDDGRAGGYGWSELAMIAAASVGARVRTVGVPRAVCHRWRRWPSATPVAPAMPLLSRGKVGELFHSDWVCAAARHGGGYGLAPPDPLRGWPDATLGWYRAAGWL